MMHSRDERSPGRNRDLERLHVFADATSHAVVIHHHGRIVDVNERFCEMFGCTVEEAVGIELRSHVEPIEGDQVIGLIDPDAVLSQRVTVTTPSGLTREVEGYGRPVMYRGRKCRVVSLVDVTDRVAAERAVHESERVMREMLGSLPLLTVMLDIEGRITFCNDRLCEVSGHSRERLLGAVWEDVVGIGGQSATAIRMRRLMAGESLPHEEKILVTSSGERRSIAWSNTTMFGRGGEVIGCMSVGDDITDRRAADMAAIAHGRQQEAVARLGVDALRMGVEELMAEAATEVARTLAIDLVAVLRGEDDDPGLLLAAASGWPPALVGSHRVDAGPGTFAHHVRSSKSPVIVSDLTAGADRIGPLVQRVGAASAIGAPIHAQGATAQHGLLIAHSRERRTFNPADANFLRAVANVLGAAIERNVAQERVAHLAFHDPLTGLPNRFMMHDRLDRVIDLARRQDRAAALIWVDIDNFQLVNDSFGERAGDDVIRQVARTLRGAAGGADLVARHAGDEFLILVADADERADSTICDNVEDVAQIAQTIAGRVRALFRSPFDAHGAEVFLRPCIGIALLPVHAHDRDGLLRHADIAKNQAKEAMRRGASLTRNALDPLHEISLTARLHRAIAEEQFLLHYQPVVDIATGELRGVEALVRWADPEHGLVPPASFIPLVERIGVIGPLTDWVVDEACRQAAIWHADGLDITVAVNVPAVLWRPETADGLIAAVRRHGIDPRLLAVEVTESTVMTDPSVSDDVLGRLAEAGLHLAIDDFGTGYSSLARLRELPASTLKIDRSFIQELGTDPAAEALVEAIVGMSRSLGLVPLAEGIETEQQRAILLAHGCRLGQGFLFSRPRPAAEISRFCALRPAA